MVVRVIHSSSSSFLWLVVHLLCSPHSSIVHLVCTLDHLKEGFFRNSRPWSPKQRCFKLQCLLLHVGNKDVNPKAYDNGSIVAGRRCVVGLSWTWMLSTFGMTSLGAKTM